MKKSLSLIMMIVSASIAFASFASSAGVAVEQKRIDGTLELQSSDYAVPTFSFDDNVYIDKVSGNATIQLPENAVGLEYGYGTSTVYTLANVDGPQLDRQATADVVLDLSEFEQGDYVYVVAQAIYSDGGYSTYAFGAFYIDDPNHAWNVWPLVNNEAYGTAEYAPRTAIEGSMVEIAVTPAEGYEFDRMEGYYWFRDRNDQQYTLECSTNTFVMPKGSVTTTVYFKPITTVGDNDVVDVLDYALVGVTGNNYAQWSGKSDKSSAVYAGQSAGGNNAIQLRSNNSNSGIVTTASGGTLKFVTIKFNSHTVAARTVDVYAKKTAYTAATDLYSASTQGTKIGSVTMSGGAEQSLTFNDEYSFIGLRSNNGALYLDEVDICWTKDADAVPVPVISGTSPFVGSTEIAITHDNDDAAIYYTLNGDEPTTESTLYNGPFTISETTTVKAIAVVDGKSSLAAVAQFEKALECTTLAQVASFDNNTEFVFTGEVTVLRKYNNFLYVQDATAGNLIYGTVSENYKFGDIIPGGWSGNATSYSSAPEITNPVGFMPAVNNVEPQPVVLALDQLTVENFGRYAVVKGATVSAADMTVGETTVAFRTNRTEYTLPDDLTKTYDVYGIADFTSSGAQFMPMSFVESQDEPGVYGDVNGDGQVTAADVSAVYNIILGASTDYQDRADVNGDGQVTAADVSVLYNIILGAN